MARNQKNLGMGLDLLLTSGTTKETPSPDQTNPNGIRELLDQALRRDEEGNLLEAYYHYRRLVDLEEYEGPADAERSSIISQAFNNAAIILYEHGNYEQAINYLRRSIDLDPDNQVAQSNLEQIINN